ncbi:hypothetical protein [Mycetocola sp. JXN-3]|uniref:hypothetical protein n=1 Tax=Mycetocola sp. JXN-3 TaxID=2116510 RepID=UPI00165D15A5|nr:hypothetical protein [Mycetocola sp. JXN-3]
MSAASAPERPHTETGWVSTGRAALFWVCAVVGVAVMFAAWFLLSVASLEEATDQSRALAAGESMAGTALLWGVLPLVLVHIAGLAILIPAGRRARANPKMGGLLGTITVIAASAIGFVLVLLVTNGVLFKLASA